MQSSKYTRIKEAAVGKWPGILSALGIDVSENQRKHTPCPMCGGKDRFRFTNETGNGEWYCNQCDPHAGDGIKLVMKVTNCDFKSAMSAIAPLVGTVEPSKYQQEAPATKDILKEIYNGSKPVEFGDTVYAYLKARGLSGMPKTLRYHPKCYEPETKQEHPAMLALFSLPDGTAVTMHRTWIGPDNGKLQIEHPKKVLPPIRKMTGGAVRLYPQAEHIGVCEGIETAIALHIATKVPVWPCLGTSLLESFIPPDGVKSVIVYGDNDANFAGQKAAYALANRLSLDGITVDVDIPDIRGDFLDQFLGETQ